MTLSTACATSSTNPAGDGAVEPPVSQNPALEEPMERVENPRPMTDLADFSDPAAPRIWRIINDGVMGGLSRSAFRAADGHATFAGSVSLENNGGFASVRAPLELADELAGATSIALRVRGDGKRYQFRVRTNNRWDGIAYKHSFETTPGTWVDVEMPLRDFRSTYRGRSVPGAPPVDPTRIRQIGFLIADKQVGSFQLDVAWIRGVR